MGEFFVDLKRSLTWPGASVAVINGLIFCWWDNRLAYACPVQFDPSGVKCTFEVMDDGVLNPSYQD